MAWNTPAELKYLKSDEYVRLEGDHATIGVSDYAQDQLNDVVYVELPEVGAHFAKGARFGTIESVKAASDLMMPIGGTVTEINGALESAPETVNASPYERGWMIRIKVDDAAEIDAPELLDADAYAAYCQTR